MDRYSKTDSCWWYCVKKKVDTNKTKKSTCIKCAKPNTLRWTKKTTGAKKGHTTAPDQIIILHPKSGKTPCTNLPRRRRERRGRVLKKVEKWMPKVRQTLSKKHYMFLSIAFFSFQKQAFWSLCAPNRLKTNGNKVAQKTKQRKTNNRNKAKTAPTWLPTNPNKWSKMMCENIVLFLITFCATKK